MADEDTGLLGKVMAAFEPDTANNMERRLKADGQSLKLDLIPALKAYANKHNITALKNLPNYDDIATILAYEGTGYDQSGRIGSSASSAYSSATGGDFSGAGKAIAGNGLWDSWNSISTSLSTFFSAGLKFIASYVTETNPRSFMAIWNQEYTQGLALSEADAVSESLKGAKLGMSEEQVEAIADFTFHRAMARYKDEYPTIETNIARRESDTSFISTATGTAAAVAGVLGTKLGLTSNDPDKEETAAGRGSDTATTEPPASTTKIDVANDAPTFEGTKANYASLAVFTGVGQQGNPVVTLNDVHAKAATLLPVLPTYNYLTNGKHDESIQLSIDVLKKLQENPSGDYASIYNQVLGLAEENLKRGGNNSPNRDQIKTEAAAILQDTISEFDTISGGPARAISLGRREGNWFSSSFSSLEIDGKPVLLTMALIDDPDTRLKTWQAGYVLSEYSPLMPELVLADDKAAAGIQAYRTRTPIEKIALGSTRDFELLGGSEATKQPPLPSEVSEYFTFLHDHQSTIETAVKSSLDPQRHAQQTQLSKSEALQIYRKIAALEPEQIDALKQNAAISALLSDKEIQRLSLMAPDAIAREHGVLNDVSGFKIADLTTGLALKAFTEAGIDLGTIQVPPSYTEARNSITVAEAKLLIAMQKNGLIVNFTANGVSAEELISKLENEIAGKEPNSYVSADIINAYSLSTYLNDAQSRIDAKRAELEKFKTQYGAVPVAELEAEKQPQGLASATAAADDMNRSIAAAQADRAARLAMDRTRVQAAVARTGETEVAQAAVAIADTDEVVALNTPTGQIPASSSPSITT